MNDLLKQQDRITVLERQVFSYFLVKIIQALFFSVQINEYTVIVAELSSLRPGSVRHSSVNT